MALIGEGGEVVIKKISIKSIFEQKTMHDFQGHKKRGYSVVGCMSVPKEQKNDPLVISASRYDLLAR